MRLILLALTLLLFSHAAFAEKTALVNGTVINPGNARVERATISIENGRITGVDKRAVPSAQAKISHCTGKFMLPGYIDTHVHFFQSGPPRCRGSEQDPAIPR